MNPLQQIAANPVAWAFEQEEYGEWVTRLSLSREAGEGEGKRNLRPLYAHPSRGVVDEAIDERASFEADYLRRFNAPGRLGMNAEGRYGHLMTRCRFEGWQARAALQAAALPAVPEVPGSLRDALEEALRWSPKSFAGSDAIRRFQVLAGDYVQRLIEEAATPAHDQGER